MRYREALPLAEGILRQLHPYCARIAIAGSLRRQRAIVNDIDIVCIPHPRDILQFSNVATSLGKRMKGDSMGRFMQVELFQDFPLELYIARLDNWGMIFTIRTGSAEFSHHVAARWVAAGYKSEDGMLTKDGKPLPVREEMELFQRIGMAWVSPWDREMKGATK